MQASCHPAQPIRIRHVDRCKRKSNFRITFFSRCQGSGFGGVRDDSGFGAHVEAPDPSPHSLQQPSIKHVRVWLGL